MCPQIINVGCGEDAETRRIMTEMEKNFVGIKRQLILFGLVMAMRANGLKVDDTIRYVLIPETLIAMGNGIHPVLRNAYPDCKEELFKMEQEGFFSIEEYCGDIGTIRIVEETKLFDIIKGLLTQT